MKKSPKIYLIILTALIFVFLGRPLWAAGVTTTSVNINLGNFTPGENKYGVAWDTYIWVDPMGATSWTLAIKNNQNLTLESNPQFAIETTATDQRFIYHSSRDPNNHGNGSFINQNGVLIPNVSYTVYSGTDAIPTGFSFGFDLKVPFKIRGTPTPLGRYSTTLVFTVIY